MASRKTLHVPPARGERANAMRTDDLCVCGHSRSAHAQGLETEACSMRDCECTAYVFDEDDVVDI